MHLSLITENPILASFPIPSSALMQLSAATEPDRTHTKNYLLHEKRQFTIYMYWSIPDRHYFCEWKAVECLIVKWETPDKSQTGNFPTKYFASRKSWKKSINVSELHNFGFLQFENWEMSGRVHPRGSRYIPWGDEISKLVLPPSELSVDEKFVLDLNWQYYVAS